MRLTSQIFLFILSLSPSFLTGQEYHFRHFTTQDGLPTNSVYGCIQDREGYIWIYTEKGVSKFDGYSFRNFTVADGLPTNDVFGLTEDAQGRIWAHGFADKAAYIYRDSIYSFPFPAPGLCDVTSTDPERTTLRAGPYSTYTIHPDNSREEKSCQNIHDYAKQIDPDNPIRFGVWSNRNFSGLIPEFGNAVTLIDCDGNVEKRWQTDFPEKTAPLLNARKKINHFFANSLDYWMNNQGIFSVDLTQDTFTYRVYTIAGPEEGIINQNTFPYFQDSLIQLSVDAGLLILSDELVELDFFDTRFLTEKGISQTRKTLDREGNIWVCTENQGLFFLPVQARRISTFVPENNSKVTSISACTQGLFFGTESGAVYRVKEDEIVNILPAVPNSNPVIDIACINEDEILAVRDKATVMLNTTKGTQEIFEEYINFSKEEMQEVRDKLMNFEAIKDFLYQEDEDLFIFGHFSGIHTFQRDKKGKFSYKNPLGKRTISLALDSRKTIWTGHDNGLGSLRTRRYRSPEDSIALLNVKTFSLITAKGKVWAGTDGNGVFCYDEEDVYAVAGTQGDIVNKLFVSDNSTLWVATNKGLKEIALTSNPAKTQLRRTFTVKEGLPSDEIHCIYTDNENIYIGTDVGLSRIPRYQPFIPKVKDILSLTDIRVNGESIDIDEKITLSHLEKEIEFHFVNLSFRSMDNIEYSYFLENADLQAHQTNNTSVRYAKLPPGTYHFHLESTNITGEKSVLTQPIEITIAAPWWRTWWFYIIAALSLAALVYALFKAGIARVERKNAEQNRIQQKFAELEMEALQAQMNPHFIFNCMNAIQNFMLNNDTVKATTYLGKFGHLMRMFLEASKNKFIMLDEEIELLKLYTELEQMRFSDEFDVIFEIDPDLDTEEIEIPSLLLQPFIENAIVHGLSKDLNRSKKKYLKVSFKEEDEYLHCVIEDNGIGREKAAELRAKSIHQHKSRATQIVNERLEVFRQAGNSDIKIEMNDLLPGEEFPGTQVRIRLLV